MEYVHGFKIEYYKLAIFRRYCQSGGLAGRRWRNGQSHPRNGLGQDSPGPYRVLAAELAHYGQPLPRLQLSHVIGVGPQARTDLQRWLLADLWR